MFVPPPLGSDVSCMETQCEREQIHTHMVSAASASFRARGVTLHMSGTLIIECVNCTVLILGICVLQCFSFKGHMLLALALSVMTRSCSP